MIQSDFNQAEQRKYERIIRGETPSVRIPVETLVEMAKLNQEILRDLPKEVSRAIKYLVRYGQEPSVGSGWTYNPNTKLVYSQNLNIEPRTLEDHAKLQARSAEQKEKDRQAHQRAKRESARRLRNADNSDLHTVVGKFLTGRTDMP